MKMYLGRRDFGGAREKNTTDDLSETINDVNEIIRCFSYAITVSKFKIT